MIPILTHIRVVYMHHKQTIVNFIRWSQTALRNSSYAQCYLSEGRYPKQVFAVSWKRQNLSRTSQM
jgi:hypothetical protein